MKSFIAALAVLNVLIIATLFVKVSVGKPHDVEMKKDPALTVLSSKPYKPSNRIVKTKLEIAEPDNVTTRVRVLPE